MPYIRIAPECFHEYGGVEVYHLYEQDEPIEYWFTTNPDNADEFGKEGQFDVRMSVGLWGTTPTVAQWGDWWKPRHLSEDHAMIALIEAAIDAGRIS